MANYNNAGEMFSDMALEEQQRIMEVSIFFAKWINSEGYREYDESDRWIGPTSNRVYTTAQLYEKFEKAKTPVTSRG